MSLGAYEQLSTGGQAQRVVFAGVAVDTDFSTEGAPVAPEQIITTTASITRVASSATSVQLLAANVNRAGLLIHNNSSAVLYIKYGTTADIAGGDESYTAKIAADEQWTMPDPPYTGRIDAIWAAANGYAMCTETT